MIKKNCLVVEQLSWMSKRSKIVQLHGCTFKVDNVDKNDLTHFRGKPVFLSFFIFLLCSGKSCKYHFELDLLQSNTTIIIKETKYRIRSIPNIEYVH